MIIQIGSLSISINEGTIKQRYKSKKDFVSSQMELLSSSNVDKSVLEEKLIETWDLLFPPKKQKKESE